MVAAGLRTGKLATALEGISATARRIADMRRGIRAAMIYPWVVTAIAFASFVLLVMLIAPRMSLAFRDLTQMRNPFLESLVWLGSSAQWWGTLIPAAVAIYLLTSSWRSQRVIQLTDSRNSNAAWRWWPGIRRDAKQSHGNIRRDARVVARTSDSAQEALLLSGDASGDRQLRSVVRVIGQRLRRGEVITPREAKTIGFPPLLAWLLTSNSQPANLALALSQIADRCRESSTRETSRQSHSCRLLLRHSLGGQ